MLPVGTMACQLTQEVKLKTLAGFKIKQEIKNRTPAMSQWRVGGCAGCSLDCFYVGEV